MNNELYISVKNIFKQLDFKILINISNDKKDKELSELKILELETFDDFVNKIFDSFSELEQNKKLENFKVLFKLFPKLKLKSYSNDKIIKLMNYFINTIYEISKTLTLNDEKEFYEFIKYFDNICDLIHNNKNINENDKSYLIDDKLKNCFNIKNYEFLIFFIKEITNLKKNNNGNNLNYVDIIENLLFKTFKEKIQYEYNTKLFKYALSRMFIIAIILIGISGLSLWIGI